MDGQWYNKGLTLVGRTAADGIVVFQVKQPVPPRVDIVDLQAYPCSIPEDFSTKEVLEQGVVAHVPPTRFRKIDKWCGVDPQAPDPQKQPAEVTFFIHPLNRLQYAWYDLWK
jgi:hypothetical protein